MCAVRLCGYSPAAGGGRAPAASDKAIVNLMDRLTKLEEAVASGNVPRAAREAVKPAQPAAPLKKFDPENYTPLAEWNEILAIISERAPAISPFLRNSAACIEDDWFYLIVASDFALKKFARSSDASVLKEIVCSYYGKNFGFKLFSSHDVEMEDQENPINELIKRAKSGDVEVQIKNQN